MSVITLKLVVGNLDSVRATFTHIKVYRSTTGLTGVYSEITDVATRIPLEAGHVVYDFTDEAGDPDYYYKSSYYHTVSGLESSKSDAQQGEGDAALDIISVSELKINYLFGLDLTDDSGTEYPDTLYQWFIKSAVSWLEIKLNIAIRAKSITDERHDFYKEDYEKYMWFKLKEHPVIDVEEVRMVLPGEEVVQTFDRDWIHVQKDSGQVNIVPGTGGAGTILMGAGGAWLPYIYGRHRHIPDVFRVDYTAGFETGEVPDIIRDAVGKVASFGPLNIAGDLLGGAGIASQNLSIDGLSQGYNTTSSATNAGYGARLLQYKMELKDVLPTLRRHFTGIGFVIG
jgi:hypothetical protein